ncbi:MAG: hypothetical protein OEY52_07725 [Gammaproteobacteria bacterium]|nr:hypothetical protein [Gammaproteobacteria bacterium]
MKKFLPVLMALVIPSIAVAEDWRKGDDNQQKLDNVVKVIPGASTIMLQMGERYRNMYWAGKQGKWTFAEYQLEEIEELIKTLIITRPKRAVTAEHFLKEAFTELSPAIRQKNWPVFNKAFLHMRKACVECHAQNQHAYITLSATPSKGNSPVLD